MPYARKIISMENPRVKSWVGETHFQIRDNLPPDALINCKLARPSVSFRCFVKWNLRPSTEEGFILFRIKTE